MYFSFDITSIQWLLLQVGALAVLLALWAFIVRILPLRKHQRRAENPLEPLDPIEFEGCAVIVYSHDEASDLEVLLPQILSQEYPAEFAVIVVNEGESPTVRELVGDLQLSHRNLYLTGTPDGARNLSRKKLAITLGIKATKMPVVVLTTAAARIESPTWLRSMMRHFGPERPIEVVLGFAAPPADDDHAFGARERAFDFLADSAAWLGPAVAGKPWRGTEHNLAYRRDAFFRNKGFSRHLNLRHGDDDIFISEISNRHNTAVELSREGLVLIPGATTPRMFSEEKARRSFTSRFIPRRPHLVGGVGFTCYFIAPLLAIAAACISPRNLMGWSAALLLLILWYCTGLIWRTAVKTLGGRQLFITLPLLAFTRPIRKFRRGVRSIFKHQKRYTWE